jgi:hypothetical protein
MAFIKESVADATSLTRPLASSSEGGRKPVEQEGEFAAESVGENPWNQWANTSGIRSRSPRLSSVFDTTDR